MDVILEFLTAFWIAATSTVDPAGVVVSGNPEVADGDSLRFGETRVRLHAIDAPEGGQICHTSSGKPYSCGANSRTKLRSLVGSGLVRCDTVDEDRYGRLVAKCFSGNLDLGEEMVRSGMAVAYTDYGWDYASVEQTARKNKVGIWAGTFQFPQEWREAQR